jgi:hypothetical protein
MLSTVDLFVLTSLDQLLLIMKMLFNCISKQAILMFQISDDMATVIGRRNVDKVRQFLKHFLSLLMMFQQKSKFFFILLGCGANPGYFSFYFIFSRFTPELQQLRLLD